MDGPRFDFLTVRMPTLFNRRRAGGFLAALGIALGHGRTDDADAKKRKKKKKEVQAEVHRRRRLPEAEVRLPLRPQAM